MIKGHITTMRRRMGAERSVLIAVGVLGIVLITTLVLYSMLATPIADVWYYHNVYTNSLDRGGLWEYIVQSLHHTGRVLQWIIVFVGFWLFKLQAVKIVPILLLAGLVLSIYWLLRQLRLFQGPQERLRAIVMSLLFGASSLYLLPSMFDSLLWLDAAAVYLAGLVMLMLNLNFLYLLLYRDPSLLVTVAMMTAMAIGQTLSEPMSALMIGLTALGTVVALIRHRSDEARKFAIALGAFLAGFALLYFSPGSVGRRQAAMPEFSWRWVLVDSLQGFGHMVREWHWWLLLLPILIIATALLVRSAKIRWSTTQLFGAATLIFSVTTYPVFVMNNYSQNYVPDRVMTLPVFGTLMAMFVIGLCLARGARSVMARYQRVAIMMCVGMVVVALPVVALLSTRTIQKVALRSQLAKTRELQVDAQIRQQTWPLRILTAPNLLKSNAEDLTYDKGPYSKHGRGWVANSYLKFKGLSEELPADAVVLVNPPELYW